MTEIPQTPAQSRILDAIIARMRRNTGLNSELTPIRSRESHYHRYHL